MLRMTAIGGALLAILASAIVACAAEPAHDDATAGKGAVVSSQKDPSQAEIYIAVDSNTRGGWNALAAATVSPIGGLETSGGRLRAEMVGLSYIYNDEIILNSGAFQNSQARGSLAGLSVLAGYEYLGGPLRLAAYGGVDFQHGTIQQAGSSSTRDFTGNPTVGANWGVKFAFESEYHPNDVFSLTTENYYSTAKNDWLSRARIGYAFQSELYAGPEIGFQGNNFYRQWRAGAHLRGLMLGPAEIGFAAGFLSDNTVGKGAYGTLEARLRF